MYRSTFILLLSYYFIATLAQECTEDEKLKTPSIRLKEKLLCGYDRTIRPVKNTKTAINVTLSIILKNIQYDHHYSSFSIDSWGTLYWMDEHLTWNSDEYDQIKSIHMHSSEIWIPDISVYNRYDQSGSPVLANEGTCIVSCKGLVVCVIPSRQSTLCVADLRKFPFDTQNCSLRIGSWVHTGEEINLKITKKPVDLDDYTSNGEWDLINCVTRVHLGKYQCCPNETYPSIEYYFSIRRCGLGYLASVVLPMLSLLVITLSTLCMDPVKFERLLLCCFNLICHFLFIEYISWHVVLDGKNVPQILVFGRDSLILTTFAIVLTLFIKKMVESKNSAPRWISASVGFFSTYRVGQFILFNSDSIKAMAKLNGEDDEGAIIENTEKTSSNNSQDWVAFGKILDRICLIIYSIVYITMFIAFVP